MEYMMAETPEYATEPERAAADTAGGSPCGDRGPGVESDPTAIIAGLRGEMHRVSLTHDTSCICIVSPDGVADGPMMDFLGDWISASLRSNDVLYRIAADKYLVLLRQIDRGDAVGFLKGLRERLLSESPAAGDGLGAVHATASFGGTMLDAQAPLHEHMDRASEAHCWALKGRGDTICMWTPRF